MSAVRMDAEPIAIKMRPFAMRTYDFLHPIAEDRRDHVVDGVDFVNENPALWQADAEYSHCSIGPVLLLYCIGLQPSVDVNAPVHRKPRRVVDRGDCAPQ